MQVLHPAYAAATACEPPPSAVVVSFACPFPSSGTVPSTRVPSRNSTEPIGEAAPAVVRTDAVSVTACPA